jgi:hypothetical protein
VARVAQARGARFLKRGNIIIPYDDASREIVGTTLHEVAAFLRYGSVSEYINATPTEREMALQRLNG